MLWALCGPRLASSTEEELFILLSCLCGVYCLSLCHLMHMKIVAPFLSWCLLYVISIYVSTPCSCKFMLHGDNGSFLEKKLSLQFTFLLLIVLLILSFSECLKFSKFFWRVTFSFLSEEYNGMVICSY